VQVFGNQEQGQFEGIGVKGLPWMAKAKALTGLPITVEVATAKQVEDALNFDVDVLWIGARTTVNPFSVQEIADALRGVDVPVLIKNPINPDLELWTGAVERVAKAGIKNIALFIVVFLLMATQNIEMLLCGIWLLK
jgi:chorismate mutase